MAAIQSSTDLQHSDPNKLSVYVTRFFKQLLSQFNGNIQFNQNIKSSSIITIAFTDTNTNTTVIHDLGQNPVGFIVINSTVPMSVCSGTVGWSSNNITLQSNAVGTAQFYAI